MRLSKIVTLLLAGFFTFGTLNSVAATKNAKTAVVKTVSKKTGTAKTLTTKKAVKTTQVKKEQEKKTAKQAVKSSQKNAKEKQIVTSKVETKKTVVKSHVAVKNTPTNKVAKKTVTKNTVAKTATASKTKSLKEQHKNAARKPYQSGVASYYADKFNGRLTANGERFNNSAMTAAHKTLPFGTLVEVTNLRNGKKVIVRVNDRGPYAHARVIDLSKTAARQLGMHSSGIAKVKLAVVDKNKKSTETVSEKS